MKTLKVNDGLGVALRSHGLVFYVHDDVANITLGSFKWKDQAEAFFKAVCDGVRKARADYFATLHGGHA